MDIAFFALGPVRLSIDDTDVRIRGRRERAVLALLLAARRQVVTVDRLIEDVWGEDAGDSAPASLQVAISRLRSLIEPRRARGAEPTLLVTSAGGYALLAPAASVDLERFSLLAVEAEAALEAGQPDQALLVSEQALGLWGGTPFGEAPSDSELIRSETVRLNEVHLHNQELRVRALLALGRPTQVVGDLETLVLAHPFRERLWELLALALYRSGRQGDALGALRRARRVLDEELAVAPSPALQQLEADILDQAAWLNLAPAVRGESPATGSAPATQEVVSTRNGLIGRDDVLAGLGEQLQRGSGTLLVSGEAGIGKTRLVTELAARAEASGAWVLWGRSHEAGASPSFWPWLAILRELAPAHPGPLIAGLLSPGDSPLGVDAGSAELRIYEAVSTLIGQRSTERPMVLIMEDAHWADSSSLRLLAYAAQSLTRQRVLFVATLREEAAPTPALRTALGALGRLHAHRVQLGGLTTEQIRDLVGVFAEAEVDDELATVITERTDGNPFFVIELVRLLASEQRLHAAGAREVEVPHGVQDVVRLRLSGLSREAGRLLPVAAVIGREFDLDIVSEVCGTDPDEAIDLLDEVVAAHAVEEGDRLDRYRFTHALVRETLLTQLSSARQARLHASIALALEQRGQDDPDQAAALAQHFELGAAIRPELASKAVHYAVVAARQAEGRGALDEALRHWEQAMGLAVGLDRRRRYDVLLGLGRARHRRGQIVSSREALNAAVALGRELNDLELVAEAASSYRGAGVWRWREVGISDESVIAVLRESAAALAPGELRARVLASLAMELTHDWCTPEAEQISREALELARSLGGDALIADVISLRMLVLWGRPGAAREQLALAEEALLLPLTSEQELYARFKAAPAHLQLGDVGAADREMIRCIELARRLRHTGADVPIAWWRFYRAVDTGDTVVVAGTVNEIIERHRRSQIVAQHELESMAQMALNDPGAPVPEAVVAQATGNLTPVFRTFVAHALAESGRVAEAVLLLGEPTPPGCWHYSSLYADCLRVAVLAMAGPGPDLEAALAQIEPWGEEFAVAGSTDYLGSVEYFIGCGREGLGDVEGARAAYGRAVERNSAVNVVAWRARAQQRLAALI